MAKTNQKKGKKDNKSDVIVDFIFDNGLFFISIKNISNSPAYNVAVKFNKRILGVEGTKEISALPLFKNIEFLAPHKEIVTFLDTSASYFKRREPTEISVTISYKDYDKKVHSSIIKHNLGIYKEIGYIQRSTHGSSYVELR